MFQRSIRAVLALSVVAIAPVLTVGCAADASGEIAPVDEASSDITAVSKLIGDYGEGQGRYASLALTQVVEDGHRSNRYEAQQIVQCVRAPCPAVSVKGKWFAKGTTLTLYPEGNPRETYKATLAGTKLTLANAQGVAVAELTKAAAVPSDIAQALASHGVPKMKVEIDAAEIDRQASAAGVTVPFATALDQALDLFLTDEEGLRSTTTDLADDLPGGCGADADPVRCVANAPRASIRLLKLDEESAPEGEVAASAWVFVFFVEELTDHGYYAVIDKAGAEAAYVYAFN